MEYRSQERNTAGSEGRVPVKSAADNTLSQHITCTEIALLALEAIESGRLIEFIEERRGTENEVLFLNKVAWGMREVGNIFFAEVKQMQDTCDHGFYTPKWKSPDVFKCVHCMYHK
jgi:hypothetical protein